MRKPAAISSCLLLLVATPGAWAQHDVEYGVNLSLGPTHYIDTYTLTITNITKTGYTFDSANSILTERIT